MKRDGSSDSLTRLGLVLSAVVLAVVGIVCLGVAPRATAGIGSGDWATILGTTFTGLAFAWLVVAYYQQGESLRLFYKSEIQPVLVFHRPGQGPWRLRNVGKGPAINVLVADGPDAGEWDSASALDVAALAEGDELEIDWVKHGTAFIAMYHDAADREYTTECFAHRNRIASGRKYPQLVARKHEYDLGAIRRQSKGKWAREKKVSPGTTEDP